MKYKTDGFISERHYSKSIKSMFKTTKFVIKFKIKGLWDINQKSHIFTVFLSILIRWIVFVYIPEIQSKNI